MIVIRVILLCYSCDYSFFLISYEYLYETKIKLSGHRDIQNLLESARLMTS